LDPGPDASFCYPAASLLKTRTRFSRRAGLTRDAEFIARLAAGLAQSGGKLEDAFWEQSLVKELDRLLKAGNEETLNSALDHLWSSNLRAHDELADLVEARCEIGSVSVEGQRFDALLITVPILAWSRYGIASGAISREVLAGIRAQLCGHVLAADTRLAIADYLFSPDQLPRGFVETAALAAKLHAAAAKQEDLKIDVKRLPETVQFLSDLRYVLCAVAIEPGKPVFRWQEEGGTREAALAQWRAQGGPNLHSMMSGSALELLLPDAYFAACRQAEQQARPYSLRASVTFLQTVLDATAGQLRAVVAPYYDQHLEEYRIGFTWGDKTDVVHGVVWPMLGADEDKDAMGTIEALLRECGITSVTVLDHRLPLEFCDECGVPLYPNSEGESVHAELPEDETSAPARLH
jgi:hypothetical protein